jgi:hypothetical protein
MGARVGRLVGVGHGDKSTQEQDIARVKRMAEELKKAKP